MKNTWKFWVNKEGKINTGKYYYFKTYKVFSAFREMLRYEMEEAEWKSSISGLAVLSGFKIVYGKFEGPKINWFGVSKYHPCLKFQRDQRVIHLSLCGMSMPGYPKAEPALTEFKAAGINTLLSTGGCKYLGYSENGKMVYETFTGQFPSPEFIKEFYGVELKGNLI